MKAGRRPLLVGCREIEYSQPVLYKHFASMDDVIEAVALEGFGELAKALATARCGEGPPEQALSRTALAFNRFATENPALCDAMFTRATRLRFGSSDSPPPLVAAFAELRGAAETVAAERDVETLTEVLWAALHGLTTLARNDRLRPGHDTDRIQLLVDHFLDASPRRS